MALTAADKTWINNAIVAQTQKAIDAKLGEIAKEVMYDYRVPGTETPGSTYRRNLTDLTGDMWFAGMVGTTRAGDPLPPEGVFGQILQDLAELSAKVDELASKIEP